MKTLLLGINSKYIHPNMAIRLLKVNCDYDVLLNAGLIKDSFDGVKVLGKGELTKKLTVKANKFSESAKKAIEAAGGSVEVM